MSFIIIILFLLMPSYVSFAAKEALSVCIESVIPSLFPFMAAAKCAVISKDIKEDNFIFHFLAKLFNIPLCGVYALIFGMICGYPVGAKTAFDLYREKRIDKKDAIRLASFTNNAGPGFVISVIGSAFLKSSFYGIIIYISHISASLITGLILRGKRKSYSLPAKEEKKVPLSESIPMAIYDSAVSSVNITAVIMFFACFSSVLFRIFPPSAVSGIKGGILSGIFEITSGIRIISGSDIPIPLKLSVITFLTGFSGLSVIFQTKSFAKGLNIKTTPCILCKVLSSLLSVFILLFLYNCHSVFCK